MEPATKRRKLSIENGQVLSGDIEDSIKPEQRHSLFVRSLPPSVTSERLIEHFSQSYPLKHATIVLDPTTKVSRGFGFVTFTDAEDARQALAEFHNSILDGRKIKVEIAEARNREVDELIEGRARSKNTKAEELRAKRQQQQEDNQPPKLIVRNLPWSIKTADDLTKLFLSYGKVKHAIVPNLPANKDAQAGFGIVIIRGKKNAERALQGVNGKVIDGRTLAVDWAVDKETWQKIQKGELGQTLNTDGEHEVTDAVQSEQDPELNLETELESQSSEDEAHGDGVLVDANGAKDTGLADGTTSEISADGEDGDLSASDISELAADDAALSSTSKFNAENTTVFVRNLPYDTTDEGLLDHFQTHFGPVRYARVVFDHETERPRGTAFVCFRHESDAKDCVKGCPKSDSSAIDSRSKHTKQAPSLLQNEATDPTGRYTLSSRLLHITRALPKPEADRRASESLATRSSTQAKTDKRRLYLLQEGTVSPGSSLYSTLSPTDLATRQSSFRQRQKLLKTNPNLCLSFSRLSIRNLPRWIDSKALKALAREAIVGFASDVKSGLRGPISKEELDRDAEEGKEADKQRKAQGKGVVKQAKVVYESEISGGKVGEGKGGRSRGYGFIEYWGHRSALMGLRWLNGHLVKKPKDVDADGEEKGKRLIVEFAVENAQVVQRRNDREKRVKDRMTREANEDPSLDIAKGGKMKRKRSAEEDVGGGNKNKNKKPKRSGAAAEKKEKLSDKDQEERNKVAARNRIIAQKRQKRKNRKGGK